MNSPEFITKQLELSCLASSFVENINSYPETHNYDNKATSKVLLGKDSPARKKPKTTVELVYNFFALDSYSRLQLM